MKLLKSPFKYKATCYHCKSEISFKDEDITKHIYNGQKQTLFILTDEIKDAILKNSSNPEISVYLESAKKVQIKYTIFEPKVICPYCGYEVTVETNSGKTSAIINSYYLISQNGGALYYVSDFERTALYIMLNKKLIPEKLKL